MRIPIWARRSALVAGLMMGSVGAAQAATDVTVNQEACAEAYKGTPEDLCPNSLTGPAGGDVTFTAKVVWVAGENPGTVTLEDTLPVGAIFRSVSGAGSTSCTPLPAANTTLDSSNNKITCTLPAFTAVGDDNAQRVNFRVTLPSVSTGWNNNTLITPTVADSNTSNNKLDRGFTTVEAADVGLEVTTNPVTSDSSKIDPGTPYTQTIKVTNHGPVAIPGAGRVVVGFTVPAGATVTGVNGSGWSCSPNPSSSPQPENTEISCTRNGALANGASVTNDLVITGTPNTKDGTVTTNFSVQAYKATGNNRMPDGQPDNNTRSGTVHVSNDNTADMTVTKTRSGAATRPLGEEITYTVTPRFLGGVLPVGAKIKVTDTVGAGLTFNSMASTDSNYSCTSNECTYTVPNPAPANYSNLPAITVKATVTATGNVSNQAEVAFESGATDPVPGNNSSTATVTGSDSADLRASKTASNYKNGVNVAVSMGTPYTYTLSVTNDGPLAIPAASGSNPAVTLTETPAAGVTITGISADNGWACTHDFQSSGSFVGNGSNSFSCTHSAGFTNGQTRSLVLNAVRTTAGNANNNFCTEFATVTGTPTRKDSNNSNDCSGVLVGASDTTGDPSDPVQADLQITKSASGAVFAGENLTYTFVVKNNGPKNAEDVVLIDNFTSLAPTGDTLVSITGLQTGQSCTPTAPSAGTTRSLNCLLGTLAVNAEQTISVTVRPNVAEVAEQRSNTAYVYSNTTYDQVPGNNSHTIDSTVTARVDLRASKVVATSEGGSAAGTKSAAAGSLMRYTVTAINDGPSSAENVWLRDVLPTEAILVGTPTVANSGVCQVVTAASSAVAPIMGGGTTHPAGEPGGVLECVWGTEASPAFLARTGQREVSYDMRSVPVAHPNSAAGKVLDNTVVVGTKTDEPNKDNNSAAAKVTLTKEELDVSIQMSHTNEGLPLGGITRYSITVRNNGPTYATNVVMRDAFPATNADGDPSSATFAYRGNLDAGTDGTCSIEPADGDTAGVLECSYPMLAPGESRVISFDMEATGLPVGAMSGTIFHHAEVKADETEWLSSGANTEDNNETRDQTSTRRDEVAADLALSKTSSATNAKPGEQVTYTLTVTNNGPEESVGAQIVDVLPNGLSFVSSDDGCVEAAGTVSCSVGTLANGATKDFTFVAELDDPYTGSRPLKNKACVDAPGDTDESNNCDEEEVVVPPLATPVPVDNPLALLALILGMGWIARRFHMRKHA